MRLLVLVMERFHNSFLVLSLGRLRPVMGEDLDSELYRAPQTPREFVRLLGWL